MPRALSNRVWSLARTAVLALFCLCAWSAGPFLVEPYLQLGSGGSQETLALLWHGPDEDGAWGAVQRSGPGSPWSPAAAPTWFRVEVPGVPAHRVYQVLLRPPKGGPRFQYRVTLGGKRVFQASAGVPKADGQAQRVVVVGDLAEAGPGAKAVAAAIFERRPDLVVVPGDIVYQDGRITEYRQHFFPVFNAGRADPGVGAPLLRSVPFVGVLGNHDVSERGPRHPFAVDPDALAYYLYWSQPLNGPPLAPGGPGAPPLHPRDGWTWKGFLEAAGERFPTMGSFSFDRGGVHWTVLDSNPYVRWDDPARVAWLTRDLQAAKAARWRFVVFHHPPFNFSEQNRYQDQWMARLWPLFAGAGVDLVFTGHIHTYARTRPLHFTPDPASLAALDPATQQGQVRGDLLWDRAFDGTTHTRAQGPILVVTGGGGAHLHLAGRGHTMALRPFVQAHLPDQHSFSLLEIRRDKLRFRQVSDQGVELDGFSLTR